MRRPPLPEPDHFLGTSFLTGIMPFFWRRFVMNSFLAASPGRGLKTGFSVPGALVSPPPGPQPGANQVKTAAQATARKYRIMAGIPDRSRPASQGHAIR